MIVVDTSALIAILFGEPSARALSQRIAAEPLDGRVMSVASYLEAGTVMAGRRTRRPLDAVGDLEAILAEASIRLEPIDAAQARIALDARIRLGRGFGAPAGLNFGDGFAYALARTLEAPLLFVGNDFTATDIEPALPQTAL